MSFYTSTNRTGNCPGTVNGNVTAGICEKACIEVNKVLDACMKQMQTSMQVTLENQTPENPTTPLTFVSASTNGESTISGLVIERLVDRPNFARVSGNVLIPIRVTYIDANGVSGAGDSSITVPFDVILFVPQPSIIPFTVEAVGYSSSPSGSYVSENVFNINACVTVIIKVLVKADILVPSYGYVAFPPCQDFTQEACTGIMDLPLFPTAVQTGRSGT